MVQGTRQVVVVADDELACRATDILAGEGVNILIVGQLPERRDDGRIVFTSRGCPVRFPGVHVTYDRVGTVFVRTNSTKDSRNPRGFTTAVLNMGRRLGILLPPQPKERKSRLRSPQRRHRTW